MKTRLLVSITAVLLLSAATAMAQGGRGRGGRGGRGGPPPGNPPGRGPVQQQPSGSERLVDDLPLTSVQQGLDARSALMAYDQAVREATLKARNELLDKLQGFLSQSQVSQIRDQLTQAPLAPQPPQRPGGIATSDLVDRLVDFDENGDGRITANELPERMQNLLALGDTNQDAALSESEIAALATRASVDDQPRGRGRGRGGPPPGRGGRGRGRGGPPN